MGIFTDWPGYPPSEQFEQEAYKAWRKKYKKWKVRNEVRDATKKNIGTMRDRMRLQRKASKVDKMFREAQKMAETDAGKFDRALYQQLAKEADRDLAKLSRPQLKVIAGERKAAVTKMQKLFNKSLSSMKLLKSLVGVEAVGASLFERIYGPLVPPKPDMSDYET